MRKGNRRIFKVILAAVLFSMISATVFAGGGKDKAATPAPAPVQQNEPAQAPVTILVAAAASLRNSFEQQLIPQFQQKYPWITVEGTYDSSGKLQTQIEEGLGADVFMSAAPTQMNNLVNKSLVSASTVKPLLENKVVLIKPVGTSTPVTGFQNITLAKTIALGDPASVPAGQYAKEAFTNLGIWDTVQAAKPSLGTNVTEVLNWVAQGSADVGIVYGTDAISVKTVEIIAEAPVGSHQKAIYPVGIVAASAHPKEAQLLVDFLASAEGIAIFKNFGFSENK
ncbi:molybdate ABC transporter substrate-binding protein [Treponema primitia]|uniref:molybdate ABC transporter substrate-binding protein n=1 Tax=Treponema primitia TaxID=88058 RepID=UPI000255511C|nr:molybdate ABC transporter substrate-binding protein [Treponema primitia]